MLSFLANLIQISKLKIVIMMENNYFLMKKVHFKTQSKNKDVLLIFRLLQETKNSNLSDKICTQENVKCHIQHEESWLRRIVIEQVNYK